MNPSKPQIPDIAEISTLSGEEEPFSSFVIRFSGDSGDGVQATGTQFTTAIAIAGNSLSTFPDFPAEIRAPAGKPFGVSSFQIHFGTQKIHTMGDSVDLLVALNPAALKRNLQDLRKGGLIIADTDAFSERNLSKAGYTSHPLEDGSCENYQALYLPISTLTLKAIQTLGNIQLSNRNAHRSKNMWVLGLVLWMFGCKKQPIADWIERKFSSQPAIAKSNRVALDAGFAYGEASEQLAGNWPRVLAPSPRPSGSYRNITGAEALCWGLVTGAARAGLEILYCSYPITPASSMLHLMTTLSREFPVTTFQAEDEIAAICAAIGASYAGKLGITASSGPGLAIKGEALGLAIATELPLVIVDVQRAGPSTGLPTKTEQSDLYSALWGRSGDAPLCVLAPSSPSDCFECTMEAVKIAVSSMTPVILLTDGYLANASEPWKIPDILSLENFSTSLQTQVDSPFLPYARDPHTLARPWVPPGTKGGAHRIGGLEREDLTGNVSYDPDNHHKMSLLRQEKILRIAKRLPEQTVALGEDRGTLAILGWGSTFGPIHQAVQMLIAEGQAVSHIHLRHLWPLPENLGSLLDNFPQVLIPEMNMGQLSTLLRATYARPFESLLQTTGHPFKISTIAAAARPLLKAWSPNV